MLSKKKIIFITGTRADYGKIKNLIKILSSQKIFDVHIFVTGMHLLKKYGSTKNIIIKENKKNVKVHLFRNQSYEDKLDIILSKTIHGFSKYLKKIKPDIVVIHGDRVETLAAAISSSFNNFLTCHIEGGEQTGTIDEHIRHSVTKLAHIHLVSNMNAKKNILRMGENPKSVFIVGSPEVDLMKSKQLPNINEVKKRYNINYKNYAILIFHPVTTNLKFLKNEANIILKTLSKLNKNTVIILPNNDPGSHFIFEIYNKFKKNKNFKFIDSMRFEHFLTLLKNSFFIIGNSSSGVREAPYYGVPTINIGTRQINRANTKSILNILTISKKKLEKSILKISGKNLKKIKLFGNGNSANKILNLFKDKKIWNTSIQKKFYYD
jgi:UDP-N-acetylglucosamine 2-epimerase (hydrolysing)